MRIGKEIESLMAGLEGVGGNLMRALEPVEKSRASRRAHLAIDRQLRDHAEEGMDELELGSVQYDQNAIHLNGVVYHVYNPLRKALKNFKGETIVLNIHSGGGGAFEGSAVYNLLRQDGRPVRTTAMGIAASAASLIFMAGDERIVAPGGMLMIHDVWSCGIGNAAEMRAMAEQLDAASNAIAELYAERAGGSVKEWRDVMSEDTYIGGDEAVEMNLATGREAPTAKPRKKAKAKPTTNDNEPAPDMQGGKSKTSKRAESVDTVDQTAPRQFFTVAWDGQIVRTT